MKRALLTIGTDSDFYVLLDGKEIEQYQEEVRIEFEYKDKDDLLNKVYEYCYIRITLGRKDELLAHYFGCDVYGFLAESYDEDGCYVDLGNYSVGVETDYTSKVYKDYIVNTEEY